MALTIDFKGRRVLVTGAARGLGRDLVKALHEQGAKVIAVSRSESRLNELKAEFPNIETVSVDLSDWDGTRKALEGRVKGIEYLINNAGVVHVSPFLNVKPEHFDDQWNTNVRAVISVSQIVVEDMIQRGNGGCIINISSMGAKVATQSLGIYDTTKAALDMLTKSMAVELGVHGIRVNSVNPTMFATDMTKSWLERNQGGGSQFLDRTPLKRMAESSEIVNTIFFLMSDHASFINASSVLIDGGYAAN